LAKKLTKRQQQVLDYILNEIHRRGYPPSVREIGKALNLSSSATVHSHLKALENKGYLRREPTKPRALEVFNHRDLEKPFPSHKIRSVPVVGRISAGSPLLAQENIEDTLPLPREFTADEAFVLRVKGDSMIEAGIFEGDYLIVKRQPTADNGDIVVALLQEEATVKRFFKKGKLIHLKPENSQMKPIITKEVLILGKAVALLRKI